MGHLLSAHQNPGLFDPLWNIPNNPPEFRLAFAFMDLLGRSYLSIMSSQLVFFIIFILAAWRIASKLGGAGAGRLAACFAAFTPVYMTAALTFDDHMFNMALVACAVAFMIEGKGWRRILFALPAGLSLSLALRYSFMPSNGLIALACGAFAFCGFALDEFIHRHSGESDQSGETAYMTKALIILAAGLAFAASVFVFGLYRTGAPWVPHVDYYFTENVNALAASPGSRALSLLAYPYLIVLHQLGPFMSLALTAGVFGLIRKNHSGRFGLLFWLFGPLIILSLIGKKNFYYDYYALAAAAPLAAVGLASFAERKLWPAVAISSVLCVATFSLWRMFVFVPDLKSPMLDYMQARPRNFLQKPVDISFVRPVDIEMFSENMIQNKEAGDPVWIVMADDLALDTLEEWRYGILARLPDTRFDVAKNGSFYAPVSKNTFFIKEKSAEVPAAPAVDTTLGQLLMADASADADSASDRAPEFNTPLKVVSETAFWALFRVGD